MPKDIPIKEPKREGWLSKKNKNKKSKEVQLLEEIRDLLIEIRDK